MRKDWTGNIKKPSAATEFLKPFNNEDEQSQIKININDNVNIKEMLAREPEKELVGIYFDPDIKEILKELNKKHGRGTQSKIVNDAVRKYLLETGIIENQ